MHLIFGFTLEIFTEKISPFCSNIKVREVVFTVVQRGEYLSLENYPHNERIIL
jgi:hypothetical protein